MADKSIVPTHMKDLMVLDAKNVSAGESVFSPAQLQRLFMPTPPEHIHQLTKGGTTFNYVEGGYVRRQLDVLFGFDWDFEVVRLERDGNDIMCLGKLTGHIGEKSISKMQAGSAKVKFKKNSKETLDLGNDYKAAATDALKKCAAEFGIARDVYYANEFVLAKIVESEVKEEEESDAATELTSEDEKLAILKDLDELNVNDKMRIVKKATGKITLPKTELVSEIQWRTLREEISNESA